MAKKKDSENTEEPRVTEDKCPDCGSPLIDQGEFIYCGDCQKMISK